jgi:hypothetical protein
VLCPVEVSPAGALSDSVFFFLLLSYLHPVAFVFFFALVVDGLVLQLQVVLQAGGVLVVVLDGAVPALTGPLFSSLLFNKLPDKNNLH